MLTNGFVKDRIICDVDPIFDRLIPRKVNLKILIVADFGISFEQNTGFGIARMIDYLRSGPESFVNFIIHKARRPISSMTAPSPFVPEPGDYGIHYDNFRFTARGFEIDQYDQIWFFGLRPGNFNDNVKDGTELDERELEILSRWMDNDPSHGVFATGDHEDLGATLCADIPRVRTMRKWVNADGVPPIDGPTRHDTTVRPASGVPIVEASQSDATPMRLKLKNYSLSSWSPFIVRKAVHPVLCGKNSAIDTFPDHAHEGWIVAEDEVNTSGEINFGSYRGVPEYPDDAFGNQVKPEVIADAESLNLHTSTDFKGVVHYKQFGAVGVYDGHQANVGRVVVDSTWHHWMNMNLVGLEANNPDAFSKITNYFSNVAIWLAGPNQQNAMFTRVAWFSMFTSLGIEEYNIRYPIWRLGVIAKDVIGRQASQCSIPRWVINLFIPELVERLFRRIPRNNPCLTCPPFELLEIYTLGGIIKEMLAASKELQSQFEQIKEIDEMVIVRAMLNGIQLGYKEMIANYAESLERGQKVLSLMEQIYNPDINEKDFTVDRKEVKVS